LQHLQGYYTVDVTIGGQTLSVDLDTGSSDIWISSSAAGNLSSAPGVTALGTTFSERYGSGDVTGDVYSGDATLCGQTGNVNFGIMTSSHITSSPIPGLWGLSYPALNSSGITQDGNFVQKANISSVSFFMSETRRHTGEVSLNVPDSTKYQGSITYFPLQQLPAYPGQLSFYAINLTGTLSVGTVTVPLNHLTIVDTGSTAMIFPQDIFTQIQPALQDSNNLPDVTFNLNGTSFVVPSSCYIGEDDEGIEIEPQSDPNDPSILLGDAFIRAYYTIFDVTNSQVGFALAVQDTS